MSQEVNESLGGDTLVALPKFAIIGRPNVGKSTLFNIITDSRKAVVKNQPGVTRDIQIETAEVWGKSFDIIDTGGVTEAKDIFSQLIREQVIDFLGSVDYLIVMMDGRMGLMPEDKDIIRLAKEAGKEFCLVVNKLDRADEDELRTAEFYEFGENVIPTALEQRKGVAQILEWITARVQNVPVDVESGPRIAMVGKPNVGKSSLCNLLLGSHRMLVSEIAGTTVDAVDSPLIYKGKKYTLIDTAGLRRSSKREDDVEIISAFKSQEAIRRANIVLLMLDATLGPTEQDAKIMEAILEDHKAVILVANKCDLAKHQSKEFKKEFREKVERVFHFFSDVRLVYISAKTGQGLGDLFFEIEKVSSQLDIRITTRELNDFFFQVIRKAPAPVYGNNNVKFFYLTQTRQKPPAFIAFANHPDGVDTAYRRFLIKNIKDRWDLWGIPIRIFCMKSGRQKEL